MARSNTRTSRAPLKPLAATAPPASAQPTGRREWLALLGILALAVALRLFRFGGSPPGLNQDEAINAWNAWCLLRTGADMTGQAWPLFYSHAIGDNRTTLYFYALMPFQMLGGLSVLTTRLPNAVAGMLCVPLVWFVGNRLLGRPAGLLAAMFMALEPWPLFLSRWGIEGGLCPLLALAPLALMLAARLPIEDRPPARPRPWVAGLAGAAAGIACYGYWPMRLYIPALLLVLVLAHPSGWRALASTRRGLATLIALAATFAATFGPLAWRHLTDAAIGRRAEMTRLWDDSTPLLEIVRRVAGRYLEHFGPDFLFVRGDRFEIVSPIGQGEFHATMALFMAIGFVVLAARARRSVSARVALALVLIYPTGDLVSRYVSVHAMRSAPGIGALVLLGAAGAAATLGWLRTRPPAFARVGLVTLALAFLGLNARYLVRYFGAYDRRPEIYHGYAADLLEAVRWLKPRLQGSDPVFCTTDGLNQPFAVVLVGLGADPAEWKRGPREVRREDGWDIYPRSGAWRFMYGGGWKQEARAMEADGRLTRTWFVVRPGVLGLKDPLHVIHAPFGNDVLWICEVKL